MDTPQTQPAGVADGNHAQTPTSSGRVWIDTDGDPSRLWMIGEVDLFAVQAAGEQLWQALQKVRVIETGEMTFMDSMGLRCFTEAARGARLDGETVKVVDPREHVRHVLRVTGVDALLDMVHPDQQ